MSNYPSMAIEIMVKRSHALNRFLLQKSEQILNAVIRKFLNDLITHLNIIIKILVPFIANMVKQKYLEWIFIYY